MVRLRLSLICLLVVLGALGSTRSAFAQPHYYPDHGPISPWMNMFQRSPGPLDNYHTFVQPQLQLQNTLGQQNTALQQQSTTLQQQGKTIRLLGHQIDNPQEAPVRPTGTSGAFMNYSHYYPMNGGGGGGRGRSASHAGGSRGR